MTKDEAVNTILGFNPITLHQAEAAVDTYAALGMLKLDEPKSARTKTLDALFKHFGASDIESIIGLLDEAGLKIVEK